VKVDPKTLRVREVIRHADTPAFAAGTVAVEVGKELWVGSFRGDTARPILSFEWRAPGAHRAAAHSHPRGHIIFPESGAFWVLTPEGTWLVPSGQAIWIPPRVHHEIYSHGPVSARMLSSMPRMPAGCRGTAARSSSARCWPSCSAAGTTRASEVPQSGRGFARRVRPSRESTAP
jgi:hypothetical protein